jgi:hypothetical protein
MGKKFKYNYFIKFYFYKSHNGMNFISEIIKIKFICFSFFFKVKILLFFISNLKN